MNWFPFPGKGFVKNRFYFFKRDNVTGKEVKMKKRILATTIVTALSMALLLLPAFTTQVQAADKIGWVGPVYKELSASLTKGFKAYYKKTYGKDVDITFVRPGGWPVRSGSLVRDSLRG